LSGVWGLGARGLLWEDPSGLGLTTRLSYLRYDDRGVDRMQSRNISNFKWDNRVEDFQLDYCRLEANALVHWRLGRFMPFLGLGYAYSEFNGSGTMTGLERYLLCRPHGLRYQEPGSLGAAGRGGDRTIRRPAPGH